jgi:hypothetical protein
MFIIVVMLVKLILTKFITLPQAVLPHLHKFFHQAPFIQLSIVAVDNRLLRNRPRYCEKTKCSPSQSSAGASKQTPSLSEVWGCLKLQSSARQQNLVETHTSGRKKKRTWRRGNGKELATLRQALIRLQCLTLRQHAK